MCFSLNKTFTSGLYLFTSLFVLDILRYTSNSYGANATVWSCFFMQFYWLSRDRKICVDIDLKINVNFRFFHTIAINKIILVFFFICSCVIFSQNAGIGHGEWIVETNVVSATAYRSVIQVMETVQGVNWVTDKRRHALKVTLYSSSRFTKLLNCCVVLFKKFNSGIIF